MWVPLSGPTELKFDRILTELADGLPNGAARFENMIVTNFYAAKNNRCFCHSKLKLSLFTNSLCGSCKDETDEQNPVPSRPYFYIFSQVFVCTDKYRNGTGSEKKCIPLVFAGYLF